MVFCSSDKDSFLRFREMHSGAHIIRVLFLLWHFLNNKKRNTETRMIETIRTSSFLFFKTSLSRLVSRYLLKATISTYYVVLVV